MKNLIIGFNLVVLLICPIQVHAGLPLDTIQARVNKALEVLRDPALKGAGALAGETKKEKLRAIADNMFDFIVLSRLTLGRNWKKLNSDQRKEFINLYRGVLEEAYMDKIMAYTEEKVVFDKETMLSDKKAEVKSRIITESGEIPVHYRAIMRNGKWKVYDVVVEGISVVKNYRSQFREILVKKSPEEMLNILRKKED
jgi:phospholipid transport system substrate-binding protein